MKKYTITITERQHKNITCFQYPSFKGFRVAIQKMGFAFMRYFPCSKYAGWEGAMQAALKERDELKELLADKAETEVYQLFLEYRDKHARRA